jgi:AmiR/NasT family two-component response regulator
VATTDPGRESIEREMEQTRQRLARNIDQLVYRASPKTIARRQAAAVKAYFVDPSGAPRTENIVKVVGGVAGVAALFVVIRKIVA